MDSIHKPPVIASDSNSFSFDFFSNCAVPFNSHRSNTSSSNTANHHNPPDAQECSQSTVASPLPYATGHSVPPPIFGTAASSIVPSSPVKAQADENGNRRIAPLPLRGVVATPSIGLKPQENQNQEGAAIFPLCNPSSSVVPSDVSLQPQANERMLPPQLPSTHIRGKKRKTIPETAPPPKAKKPCKSLSEKQKGKQRSIEVANDNQVPSVPPPIDSVRDRDSVTSSIQQALPSAFQKHVLPNQSAVPHALESTAHHNEFRAIHPSTWIVNDPQHLKNLFASYSVPEMLPLDTNRQYPSRILDMIINVFDQSQRILSAYFVPYIWFPEAPNYSYRIQPDDKYFWGQRIFKYQHRVQCGRIAYTITGRPVLFFKREEKEMIDLINYNIILNAHHKITPPRVTQSSPGIAIDQGLGPTILNDASNVASSSHLPTQEQCSNMWDFNYTSPLTEATIAQPHPLPSTSLGNSSVDLRLNNEADFNNEFNYNTPSIVHPAPPSQSFPEISNLASQECQLFNAPNINDNDVPNMNINTGTSPDFIFNINDLPVVEETPSNEISQSFSEPASLGSTHSIDSLQPRNDTYDEFDVDSFLRSFDDTTVGSTVYPGPSNIAQSLSELEEMYTNSSWFESQDAPSTSN